MKNTIKGYILGILTMIVVGVSAAIVYSASEVVFTPNDSTWNVTNVEDAINDLKNNYVSKSELVNKTWDFEYTGSEQTFNVSLTGTYRLETWGAQGGSFSSYPGGYGAYSVGEVYLEAGENIYINVGGQGSSYPISSSVVVDNGGYNGGGYGKSDSSYGSAGGGGATHIASVSGLLSSLSSKKDNILIVAAGGGGAYYNGAGSGTPGSGGGISGVNGIGHPNYSSYGIATGGTQTAGGTSIKLNQTMDSVGSFGQGANMPVNSGSGGGGGLYGGGAYHGGGGAGGSSYIGNSSLSNKAMYCYNCTTSNEESTKTISNTCTNSAATEQCSKSGNGYAKITLISLG